ncbi:MAG: type II secretion system F family protein [Chloroflexi bacterium]|nr:type II secretion system F family protein [Chloroflexota bacterium]
MLLLSIAASLMVTLGIVLVVVGIYLSRRQQTVNPILNAYGSRPPTLEELELQQPLSERVLKPIKAQLVGLISSRTPQSTLDDIRAKLESAGNPNKLTVADFLGIKGFAALIVGGLALFFATAYDASIVVQLLAPIGGAYVGQMLPGYWLNGKISARQKEVEENLPDALDLLTISVEAGMGFEGAIGKVVDKWDNALTEELGRMLREQRMGVSRRDSLRNLAQRSKVPDLSSFAAAIIQADQLGVSIARILQIQSEQMRMKRRQRAEKLAAQAPLKMTFPMVLFMMPALWIVILGPMVPYMAQTFGGG